jgi:hypothetical protein
VLSPPVAAFLPGPHSLPATLWLPVAALTPFCFFRPISLDPTPFLPPPIVGPFPGSATGSSAFVESVPAKHPFCGGAMTPASFHMRSRGPRALQRRISLQNHVYARMSMAPSMAIWRSARLTCWPGVIVDPGGSPMIRSRSSLLGSIQPRSCRSYTIPCPGRPSSSRRKAYDSSVATSVGNTRIGLPATFMG